ncbi:PRC-barrel domain-containing protein [Anaerospora hongkongensis]|uniref:PRC-barrel domain-containing protein n=1 Tax=Anaerospora hongkongensis TaxID=244830 RepID=UPI0028986A66|nr:PRC-barrel domain-containing protein [Anaerospora hongkongensis]
MKKSTDILGLPVISIMEGKELGNVKSLVINPNGGIVTALVRDEVKWYLEAKLLPFSAITGIGEYAVTIEDSSAVASISTAPEFEKLLAADIKVIGTKILTKSGRIHGKVTEILIDDAGQITACEIEDVAGQPAEISAQRILTYGKDVLIIKENTDEQAPLAAATVAQPIAEPAPVAVPEPVVAPVSTPAATEAPVEVPAATAAPNEASSEAARKFDDKHRKYLLGKKANRRIETDNGMVIIEQGGEITEEVLQKAKLAGKFVELSMSI